MSSFTPFNKNLTLQPGTGTATNHVTFATRSTNTGQDFSADGSTNKGQVYFPEDSTTKGHVYLHQGLEFTVDPQVFSPQNHSSSAWFTQQLANRDLAGKEMIEIGCGSGFAGQFLVAKHGLSRLMAADVCLPAVACATKNSKQLNIADRVTVRHSDVFDNIPSNTTADIIYWNHPWILVGPDWVFKNDRDRALRDPGYEGLEKYLRDAPQYLKPGGQLLLGFDTKGGNRQMFRQKLEAHGYVALVIAKGDTRINGHGRGVPVLYELVRPSAVPVAKAEGQNL